MAVIRCYCEGHYGTVRYQGTVPPSEGEWFGVEWDVPSRGKHSGIHEGIQYFTCRVENSGSFVREKKLDFGMTFLQGIMKKYQNTDISKLEAAILEGILVSTCDSNPNDIQSTLLSLKYLEISETLLSNWYDLSLIVRHLPLLSSLVIRNNIMGIPCDPFNDSYNNITYLSIVQMNFTTKELILVLEIMNKIKQLCVAKNSVLSLHGVTFPLGIVSIDISSNALTSNDLLLLQHLPNLSALLLHDNKISDITIPSNEFCFPVLNTLSVSDNSIHSWSSIDELSKIKSLNALHVSGNPIMKSETVFVARQMVIAKIPQLTVLHKSNINRLERTQAERDYIQKYMIEWTAVKDNAIKYHSFITEHPQYSRLISVHGLPETKAVSNSTALKNRLIAVTIATEGRTVHKKLPDTITVVKLKGMIQRLCGIDYTKQSLSYISREGGMLIEINDDLKQLSYYSLESGDVITVNEI